MKANQATWPAMANHLKTELVLDALDMALAQRRPESVVHHSDRGCQYSSYAFGKRCRETGVVPSMGSTGDAYDNAMAECFFATLEALPSPFILKSFIAPKVMGSRPLGEGR